MPINDISKHIKYYQDNQWIKAKLPTEAQVWIMGPYNKSVKQDSLTFSRMPCELKELLANDSWQWPSRLIYFFSDLHADKDAFMDSLLASGGVKKTGPKDDDFRLSKEGKKARFIVGGDCFDKGPSSLHLLRLIKVLIDKGANVTILSGNHDARMLIGILSLTLSHSAATEHFFVRMGIKPLPLFKEIYDHYFKGKKLNKKYKDFDKMSNKSIHQQFFPTKNWAQKFPDIVKGQLSEKAISKEIKNTTKKVANFEHWCDKHDLTLKQLNLAVKKWQELFLSPKGEFYWFFNRVRLAVKEGSFFFVHAGADDIVASMIQSEGINGINKRFKKSFKSSSKLCELYYGPLGNMIRTKYRDTDHHFSRKGTLMLRKAGINVIVHGHRNLAHGQRIMLRKGMINFECDTSLDINTRKKEGLKGLGASVTIIRPEKQIFGVSSDYPFIKVFEQSV